jgi:hypothetical protein
MVFDSRRCQAARVALAAVLLPLVQILTTVSTVSAQLGTPVAAPQSTEAGATLPPAWLEFGPDGQLMARVIVDGECPALAADGFDIGMTRRAPASNEFPVVACEATIPFGTRTASILDQDLPLPQGPILRIAVIGDTGCRVNDWEKKYQACDDPEAWPFAQVAGAVADWDPDLIVHVGDYLYRESPCPEGMAGCQGNPHGDNWATWDADFFTPAGSALGAAPWLFMRGNHETCDRNPVGWFTFLDPRRYQSTCQRFTEPYVTTLPGVSFAVIDSAEAADTSDTPQEAAEYARQFDLLDEITPAGSWLVTHRPVWGILAGKEGEFQVENAAFEAATGGSLKPDYGLVLSGHIHVAESIGFDESSDRPPQLVSGNAGTALDEVPTASPTARELGDRAITEAETLSAFGFMTIEPAQDGWIVIQRDKQGAAVLTCALVLDQLTCELPEGD